MVCSGLPVRTRSDKPPLQRQRRGGSHRGHLAEDRFYSLDVVTLSPVVYSHSNLLTFMYLKAVFYRCLTLCQHSTEEETECGKKGKRSSYHSTSPSQKAAKDTGCIFSQLVSCHLGIPLVRYSLKDSVWNSLTSFIKYFLCLPFSIPLLRYSQKFYKMLILHSREKNTQHPRP